MARQTLTHGFTISTPEATRDEMDAMHAGIVEWLKLAHAKDVDISGLLAGALTELAHNLGSAEEVIVHRSGSWEAGHVYRLAGGYER